MLSCQRKSYILESSCGQTVSVTALFCKSPKNHVELCHLCPGHSYEHRDHTLAFPTIFLETSKASKILIVLVVAPCQGALQKNSQVSCQRIKQTCIICTLWGLAVDTHLLDQIFLVSSCRTKPISTMTHPILDAQITQALSAEFLEIFPPDHSPSLPGQPLHR